MALVRRARNTGKHTSAVYLKHALGHGAQALVLVIPATIALWTVSVLFPLAMMIAGEVLLLALLPRSAWFRQEVDRRIDRIARQHAAAARAALLERMSDDHRIELERIERLGASIRERGSGTVDPAGTLDEWLGLNRLYGVFVRLAVAHQASSASFRAVSRVELSEQVVRLEQMLRGSNGPARTWVERRLAIARRRIETWDRAREERELMVHGLATIAELVRWMHEQCATTATAPVRADLEDMLASWEQNGATLRELSALCDGYDAVDVEVLELGRDEAPLTFDRIAARSARAAAACARPS